MQLFNLLLSYVLQITRFGVIPSVCLEDQNMPGTLWCEYVDRSIPV